jgi:predicted phosphoribosyltransferase
MALRPGTPPGQASRRSDGAAVLAALVDEFVCLVTPEPFYAVGNFFEEWPQVTDDEVRALLLTGNTL